MKTIKIGFDAKRAFHNMRGLGNYARTLLQGLDRFYPENSYHLFTPALDKNSISDWAQDKKDFTVHTPSAPYNGMLSGLWRSFLLGQEISRNELDIFHGLSHELPLAQLSNKTKYIVTIHDLIYLRYPQFFPWIDRKIYHYKIVEACKKADVILSICEQTSLDLFNFLEVPKEKVKICYQSCDPRFYENRLDDNTQKQILKKYGLEKNNYVLYVAALEERKNAIGLVKAMASLKNKIPLVVIGRGKEYRDKLLETVKKYGLTNQFILLENVPMPELPAFYSGAILFCYPSFFEGFGIPIIESLFCNTPVVTSIGSCFPEAGGPGAIYTNPNEPESIAEGINKLIEDESFRKAMGERGRNYVERFHWCNTSKNLMDIYYEMLTFQ